MADSIDIIDTLRLPAADIRALMARLDELERAAAGGAGAPPARFGYRQHGHLVVCIQQGHAARYLVAPRHIGAAEFVFLHGTYVHVGSRCICELVALDQERVLAPGTVRRCQQVEGRVHEVEVRFDQPISLDCFANDACPDGGEAQPPQTGPVARLARELLDLATRGAAAAELRAKVHELSAAIEAHSAAPAGLAAACAAPSRGVLPA